MTNYAPNGTLYYSVITPSVFSEHMLPSEEKYRTKREKRIMERLSNLAEIHGTYVQASPYELG